MGSETKIEWTNRTFNPWRGCSKISPGCTHCYADRQSKRNPRVLSVFGPRGTRVLASKEAWRDPHRWNDEARDNNRRDLVFCASMADVFEDWDGPLLDARGNEVHLEESTAGGRDFPSCLSDRRLRMSDGRERLFNLIRKTPNLIWQLLTKRPQNIGKMMPGGRWDNVWLGTSVESQDWLGRAEVLINAPQLVPVRFLSLEPLLSPLDLRPVLSGIDWVIVGGESGGGARPLQLDWVRGILNQCRQSQVAVFVKQLGRRPQGARQSLRLIDRKGGNWDEWPEDLCVREYPLAGGRPAQDRQSKP